MKRIAIIGFGRMGITHHSILNCHPKIKIVAVVDKSKLIINLLKKYIGGIKIYDDYDKLFINEKLDAVIICTPPILHYPIAMMAAKNKAHVFLEKPCTLNKSQANELAIEFEGKNLVNQVGYVNRFNDIFTEVQRLITNDVIGELIRFKSEMFSSTIIEPSDSEGWRGTREKGGGALYEMAAHSIDLVNYLVGKPDKIVGSSFNSIYSKNVEDVVSSTFIYKNGCSGTLYVNWSDSSYRKPTNKIELFGTKGKILADQHSYKIYCNEDEPKHNFRKGWNTRYITDVFKSVPFYVRGNEFTRQLYHFIKCIEQPGKKNLCSFIDGADTQQVIHEIFNDFEINGKA